MEGSAGPSSMFGGIKCPHAEGTLQETGAGDFAFVAARLGAGARDGCRKLASKSLNSSLLSRQNVAFTSGLLALWL